MKTKILTLLIIISFTSCKPRNKLNSNEQQLVQQISKEEKEKQEVEAALKQNVPAIPDTLPLGLRFKVDRSIDTQFPPKVIDIANLFNSEKKYKLSELITEIDYITLEDIPVDDSYQTTGFETFLADNHLLIKSMFSLYLYNRDGRFKDVICKGDLNRTKEGGNSNVSVISTSAGTKGVWGDVWTLDNKLFYRYADNKAKKFILMSYDMDSEQNSIPLPNSSENFNVTGKGEMHASLGIERNERYTEIVPLSKDSYAGINRKTKSAKNGLLMTTFRLNGDTLNSFPDYETISNYSHSVMRGNFPQISYHYGNVFTFRNAFNDTVYRVVPPNRLIPAYILNMGDFKIETQEGFTPGQDISDKLYIKEFFETRKYIYLKLFQGYDSPKNREKKSVQIYYAIYEKETGKLNKLPINPLGYSGVSDRHQSFNIRKGVLNDIDGGFIFWPHKVSPKGEAYEVVLGEKLKKHISSEQFIKSTAPKNKKDELKELSEKVRDDQLILIVYKTH